MQIQVGIFVWDAAKERENLRKHGVSFVEASRAFLDPHRRIFIDEKHSIDEQRFFCLGEVQGRVLTVRFLYREDTIRIFGAGYWRKGRSYYAQKNA